MKSMSALKYGVAILTLSAAPALAEPLKIAVIDATSGPAASTALPFIDGTKYAIDKLNAAGGFNGEKIQLTIYDNQSSPATASDKLKAAIADGAKIISQSSSSVIGAQLSEDIKKYNERNPGKEVIFSTTAAKLTTTRPNAVISITSSSRPTPSSATRP